MCLVRGLYFSSLAISIAPELSSNTLQRTLVSGLGTLQVDIEDGDHSYEVGKILKIETLYLITEMRQMVTNANKFNHQ